MKDTDYVPDLYTERDIVKARRRNRLVGRIEGAGAVLALGLLWRFVPLVTGAALIAIVAYVIYKMLSKPDAP